MAGWSCRVVGWFAGALRWSCGRSGISILPVFVGLLVAAVSVSLVAAVPGLLVTVAPGAVGTVCV